MPPKATQNQRFLQALRQHESSLLSQLNQKQIAQKAVVLFLRAFKAEEIVEVWIKNQSDKQWQFLKAYSFCQSSGVLGPKRKEGDRQIPEGIYHIDRFNPKSTYHLSLGLNYPNLSDYILGDPESPGSDIFIHGGCETIGCIPITDSSIEEVYLLASWAQANGQAEIPVHIFPFCFTTDTWAKHLNAFPQHKQFWLQLERIYQVFEQEKKLPTVRVRANGDYKIDVGC